MSRIRLTVVNFHDLDALLGLTAALAAALPEGSSDSARAEEATENLREALLAYDSPFQRYRKEILGGYSTATRLQELVLHLWNDGYKVCLGRLFMNADERHAHIALELITSYTANGENDPDFMRLADEIRDMRMARVVVDEAT